MLTNRSDGSRRNRCDMTCSAPTCTVKKCKIGEYRTVEKAYLPLANGGHKHVAPDNRSAAPSHRRDNNEDPSMLLVDVVKDAATCRRHGVVADLT